MSISNVIRPVGQTIGLSVGATATTATLVNDATNDQVNYVALLNTGSTNVAVTFGQTSSLADPVLPSGATLGDFVLPPLMTQPIIVACPTVPFYLKAIGSGAGPSLVYITPVDSQS